MARKLQQETLFRQDWCVFAAATAMVYTRRISRQRRIDGEIIIMKPALYADTNEMAEAIESQRSNSSSFGGGGWENKRGSR